jgi:hypothetical protein
MSSARNLCTDCGTEVVAMLGAARLCVNVECPTYDGAAVSKDIRLRWADPRYAERTVDERDVHALLARIDELERQLTAVETKTEE